MLLFKEVGPCAGQISVPCDVALSPLIFVFWLTSIITAVTVLAPITILQGKGAINEFEPIDLVVKNIIETGSQPSLSTRIVIRRAHGSSLKVEW